MKALLSTLTYVTLAATVLSACAPRPTQIAQPGAQTDFGPKGSSTFADSAVNLKIQPWIWHDTKAVLFSNSNEVLRWLETSSDIVGLLPSESQATVVQFNNQIMESLRSSEAQSFKYPPRFFPYVEFALHTMAPSLVKKINTDTVEFEQVLNEASQILAKPIHAEDPADLLIAIENQLKGFLGALQSKAKNPVIPVKIQALMAKDIFPTFTKVRYDLVKLKSKSEIPVALDGLAYALNQFKYLPQSFQNSVLKRLSAIANIVRPLSVEKSPAGVLTSLTRIWELMTPEERVHDFKANQPELYDAFNGLTAAEFVWLRANACDWSVIHPILGIISSKVCSHISNAGVNQVRDKILLSLARSVRDQFAKALSDLSQSLGKVLVSSIQQTLQEEAIDFAKNHPQILRQKGYDLIEKTVSSPNQPLYSVPDFSVQVVATEKQGLHAVSKSTVDSKTLDGESAGRWLTASLSLSERNYKMGLWKADSKAYRTQIFSALNHLVSLVGFESLSGSSARPLIRPLAGGLRELEFRKPIPEGIFYSIPDVLHLNSQFEILKTPDGPATQQSDPVEMAEILRGVSTWLVYSQDWKKSAFDQSLGGIEFDGTAAIPKAEVYALGVGVASVLLSNLEKSGLVLIDLKGQTCLLKLCNDATSNSIAAAPFTVSQNGSVPTQVSTLGAIRLIRAIETFLIATDGVELTQSESLNEIANGEKATLKKLLSSRKQLGALSYALANFVSGFATRSDGTIAPGYDLAQHQPLLPNWSPRVQLEAIQAWVAVYDRMKAQGFLWSAWDAFGNLVTRNVVLEANEVPVLLRTARDLRDRVPKKFEGPLLAVERISQDYLGSTLQKVYREIQP